MVQVGDRVILFNSKDKCFIEERTSPQVGEAGMIITSPTFNCFLPKTSLDVGNTCRIYSTKDKYIVRGKKEYIGIIEGIVYPASASEFPSTVFSACIEEISIRGTVFSGGIEI